MVYAVVMAHNFIPHHHHSEFAYSLNHNESHHEHEHHHKNGEHHHHHEDVNESGKVEHEHETETHIHCSFKDALVLNKRLNISDIYVLVASFAVEVREEVTNQPIDRYIIPRIAKSHCRDVQLRGPPLFS